MFRRSQNGSEKRPPSVRLDLLADDGRPERIPARTERADHRVLDGGAHVEFGLVLGLKEQTIQLDDRQDRPALEPDHGVGDMAQIGDVGRHRPFAALLPAKPKLFDDDVQHGHGP